MSGAGTVVYEHKITLLNSGPKRTGMGTTILSRNKMGDKLDLDRFALDAQRVIIESRVIAAESGSIYS